ncbi:unannotated protein [freshwater metagenome]|uniref:Unannotated protein n=1 Tax=freshwater metagenome TaxID=449393 RepID=A0A6J7H575_9ZZZZ|nr:DEAD/DEAH box helicase [Actinomycetota bacterium]
MSEAFGRLHPAVQHHVVNSLGWRSLRPLQEQSIEPVLAGHHALLGAPTAGGKTEAALFPLLSRMMSERWSGLSVLYICPLRALLNNLLPRVQTYAILLGRTAAMWHGDVGASERKRLLADPPDVLLTTPESIEAMFLSRRTDATALLRNVQAVVVDEIHAFAADDRGWHLQAVLARLDELTGREVQRLGLTATVGNPDWLVEWLACGGERPAVAVMADGDAQGPPDLTVDWVQSVPNAARVVSKLHRGEKRLVFADSRSRVEEFAAELRAAGTTVFVSHSSLSRDDRHQAEKAFAETRDCVIVSTSTLELGIDVGDLDRVIQLGAPATVASLQQRMGRTGRRPGSRKNCLFLATSEMELLQAVALCRLIGQGWVEPLVAPPRPTHLLAHQALARVLADGRMGRSRWPGPIGRVAKAAGLGPVLTSAVLDHMVKDGVLIEDAEFVQIGEEGERRYGRRHFMDVTSLFLTEPLMTVRWGQREIGTLDPSSLLAREGQRSTVLLGGKAWGVEEVEWNRRLVWVVPADDPGKSRWNGGGRALSAKVCDAIREVAAADDPANVRLSKRTAAKLGEIRLEMSWATSGATTLEYEELRERTTWWTFAGGKANHVLSAALTAAGIDVMGRDDLQITMTKRRSASKLREACADLAGVAETLDVPPAQRDAVKFGDALTEAEVERLVRARQADVVGASEAVTMQAISVAAT